MSPRIITGKYCMEELPIDYPKIIHKITSIRDDFTSVIGIMNNLNVNEELEDFNFCVQTATENVYIDCDELRHIELREE